MSRTFDAPGPGAWELEGTHFTRPITPLMAEVFPPAMAKGFSTDSARYGLMLSHLQMATVHGFVYQKAIIFGAPPAAVKPPPRPIFYLITRLVPKMRARIRTGHQAINNRLWRSDLKNWDDTVKPASIRAHRAIQAIDVRALDDAALKKHFEVARDHLSNMICQHHLFTITACMPVGDFLAHAQEWTGKPSGEILHLLKGASPISNGVAADELDRVAAALKSDPAKMAVLSGGSSAAEILTQLKQGNDAVATALGAYLDVVGYRSLGYDICDPFALELPQTLVKAIRSSVDSGPRAHQSSAPEKIAELRAAVPAAHRERFDELLNEARHVYRIRDERGQYSDAWANGLLRRAVLEIGCRLSERQQIPRAELVFECRPAEMMALLDGQKEPSVEDLNERGHWRSTKTIADVPPWLGAPPSPPPPVEWLPQTARRTARAVDAVLGNLFGQPAPESTKKSVKGLPVSAGVYEGIARVVKSESDFGRIEKGDVLVTRSTSPYFNVVLPLLGAIVTDRGGQLSHAAIVSREYGIPAVVGTTEATTIIADGARVRVDGTSGEVHVIG